MVVALKKKELDQLVSGRAARRLRAFRRDVDKAFAGRVTDIVLFGSRARGDAAANSDYDVAVFVRHFENRRILDHKLADIAYPHILEGVHIRPVSVPDDLLDNPNGSSLAVSILRDGVAIP
jgi:predicted nucleotidyltransferase